jgi:hypothetical protein
MYEVKRDCRPFGKSILLITDDLLFAREEMLRACEHQAGSLSHHDFARFERAFVEFATNKQPLGLFFNIRDHYFELCRCERRVALGGMSTLFDNREALR